MFLTVNVLNVHHTAVYVIRMIFTYETNLNISQVKQSNEVLKKLFFIFLNDLLHVTINVKEFLFIQMNIPKFYYA